MILESANTFFSQKNSDNLYIDTVLSTMNIQKSVCRLGLTAFSKIFDFEKNVWFPITQQKNL